MKNHNTISFFFSRSTLASYILGLDVNIAKNKKHVEDMFFSVFSALLDALLLRAQVLYLPSHFVLVYGKKNTNKWKDWGCTKICITFLPYLSLLLLLDMFPSPLNKNV